MTTRGRKPRPGRIMFVGSGPGDPALLTTRAASVLANAPLVFIDPDVPEPVLALIGKDLPPVSGPAPAEPAAASDNGAAEGTGTGTDENRAAGPHQHFPQCVLLDAGNALEDQLEVVHQ